jgi:hypothetical protein
MNRLAVAALILSVALSACIPGFGPVSAGKSEATMIALAGTLAAQTVAAQPTSTVLPSNTPTVTVPPTITSTVVPAPTETLTPAPDSQTTASATRTATVTGTLPGTSLATATLTTVVGIGTASPTDLMVPRTYGTQPPTIAYGRVRLINLAHAQVYISFQCRTQEGLEAVVEYPVSGTITVSVPAGRCHYVAWVGGREFVGDVGIHKFEELVFKFKKTEIIIQ